MINLAGGRRAEDGNKGFTLIELMAAAAVLSVMGGLFLQGFVSAGRMNEMVFLEEQIRGEARLMMEEIKGYSSEILEENGYHFSRQVELPYGGFTGGGGGMYRIDAEVDPEYYRSENGWRMPDIVDVSSPQNIVLEPGMFSGETVQDGEEIGDDEDIIDEDAEYGYEENGGETRRYLYLTVSDEISGTVASGRAGTLKVRAEVIFAGENPEIGKEEASSKIYSWKRELKFDDETRRPDNRIYVFLPDLSDEAHFEKVFVTADDLTETYRMYVILAGGGENMPETGRYLVMVDGNFKPHSGIGAGRASDSDAEAGFRAGIASDSDSASARESAWDGTGTGNERTWNGRLQLYTNADGGDPVSEKDAGEKLYRVTVRVYGPSGREVMRLESSRTGSAGTESAGAGTVREESMRKE